jgi:hypothetical protein
MVFVATINKTQATNKQATNLKIESSSIRQIIVFDNLPCFDEKLAPASLFKCSIPRNKLLKWWHKEKGATFSRNPLILLPYLIWLLDLGSNQGPTD